MVSQWLERINIPTKFERGLRVTDEASLEVVVAVLAGLVNKRLVASLSALGVTAVGLSGCDGAMLRAELRDQSLGFVGEIMEVDAAPFRPVLRGLLLTGSAPRYLRADLGGKPTDPSDASEHALWWPPSKIAGRWLAPYLALNSQELKAPEGVAVQADLTAIKLQAILGSDRARHSGGAVRANPGA